MVISNGSKITCEKIIIDSKKIENEHDDEFDFDIKEKSNSYEYHPNVDIKTVKHRKKRSDENNVKIEEKSSWWDPGNPRKRPPFQHGQRAFY